MKEISNVGIGSDVKINITMEPLDGMTLRATEWTCEFFAIRGKVAVSKSEATMVDDNNYICPVDTTKIGKGELCAVLKVRIPDGSFPDGYRDEVTPPFYCGVTIV